MKPTKQNLEILKLLGFKVYKDGYGVWEAQLFNGWSISIEQIRSFKWLMKRLYVGQAENCMYNGDIFKDKGYCCVGMSLEDYKKFKKCV